MRVRVARSLLFSAAIIFVVWTASAAASITTIHRNPTTSILLLLSDPNTFMVNVHHNCPNDPLDGTTHSSIPLETYVKRVLPNEWAPYWNAESLDAGAVAARSWVLAPIPRSKCQYPFGDGVCYFNAYNCGQDYVPGSEQPSTDTAVNRTRYQYLSYEAPGFAVEAVNTQYRSDTGNRTMSWQSAGSGYPYLKDVAEPVSTNTTIGPGASQIGSQRWANGVNLATGETLSVNLSHYEQILAHYYTGVHLRDGDNNNAILTPAYRWNALQINYAPTAPVPRGSTHHMTVWAQNTGTTAWYDGSGLEPQHALSYRIYQNGQCVANCNGSRRWPLNNDLDPGDDKWFYSADVFFPSTLQQGLVAVRFDVVQLVNLLAQGQEQEANGTETALLIQPSATNASVDFWFSDQGCFHKTLMYAWAGAISYR